MPRRCGSRRIRAPAGSSGQRPPLAVVEEARGALRAALAASQPPSAEVIDQLLLPLVEQAVPEWRAVLDNVLELPEIGGPVGLSGGVTAIGVRLAVVEPRIVAVGLFAGSFVPRVIVEEARQVTIPVHVLLQWDDRGNDRQAALDLFDALGSTEKTLHLNPGSHVQVPTFERQASEDFYRRHLLGGSAVR